MERSTGWTRRAVVGALGTAAFGGARALAAPTVAPAVSSTVYFDGLSFLPEQLDEVSRAGLGGMICDVSRVEEVRDPDGAPRYRRTFAINDRSLDDALARLSDVPHVYLALRGDDIGRRPGCATFLQFQSAETLDGDLSRLAYFHGKGLRVLQFTHHNDNALAGGAIEPVTTGLTPLGREALDEMNRLRLAPDVSHGSEATMLETARRSRTPILLSHGACRAIVDHPRCASDQVIRTIAKGGGVMGVFMMSFWLTRAPEPRVEHLLRHIRHVIKVGGIETVGIANDFPMSGEPKLAALGNNNRKGVANYLEWWTAMRRVGVPGFDWTPEHVAIPELNRLDRMTRIHQALDQARFRPREIDRIMGGNWTRVLTDILG